MTHYHPRIRELEKPDPNAEIADIKTRLDKLESYLSFLEMYKPKIERLVAICHTAKSVWSAIWKLIVGLSITVGAAVGISQLTK